MQQDDPVFYDPESNAITSPLAYAQLEFAGKEQASSVTLRFLSPTRMLYNGKMARRPAFHVVPRLLLRRIELLTFFPDTPVEIDYTGLIEQAESVNTTVCSLATFQWRRYSSRQDQAVEMEV